MVTQQKEDQLVMRIAIDALGIDQPGGARTATLGLFEEVIRLMPQWHFVFYLSKLESSLDKGNVKQVILPFRKGILARLLFQMYLPLDLLCRRVDLIHFAKSQACFMPATKTVFTIFDLTTLLYPDQFSKTAVWYWSHIQGCMARAADAVVAISNDDARDIVSFFKVPVEKVETIYLDSQFKESNYLDPSFVEQVKRQLVLPTHYMLVVGLLAKKKNLEMLIRAMALLHEQQKPSIPLLLVGPRYTASDASDLLGMIHSLDLDHDILYLGSLPPGELQVVMQNAFCLLLPSVHEGFGITAIEAIKMGVPVIASNVSALQEIIGGGGLLVDDFLNPASWVNKVQRLLGNDKLRNQLVHAGYQQAERFSWNTSARQLIDLYTRIHQSR